MATVAVDFTHFDDSHRVGDVLPDDHELVSLAPHLFVQPDPSPDPEPEESVRIRGPLVNPPQPQKKERPS